MGSSNAVLAGSFTLAYWCVLVAALLPYVCASLAKAGGVGKSRKEGGFDNHDPRAWLADVLARIADHPLSKLDELMPWNWAREMQRRKVAA